jgi:Leucine-rich repeat (LRR) protein
MTTFSGRNLKTIPSSIGDLANIVALDHFAATSSSMPNLRTDGRQGGVPVQLFLANNLLTPSSFPLSFFSLSNLTVLSLRGNPLSELPPSIGQLRALKELYLGGNGLVSTLAADGGVVSDVNSAISQPRSSSSR